MTSNRRKFLQQSAVLALAGFAAKSALGKVLPSVDQSGASNTEALNSVTESATTTATTTATNSSNTTSTYLLPPLPYAYDALEPHIDKLTMEIHHDKHHKAYVDNLNKAFQAMQPPVTELPSLENLMATISKYPTAIRNNGGGHYNHSLFWKLLAPPSNANANLPTGKLAEAINKTFGSFDSFKSQFSDAAAKRFGSGWAWLILDKTAAQPTLKIISTANQDNPLMDVSEVKGQPILALDVWEHAYYLHYQNKRADYVASWWNIVNWSYAEQLFNQ